MISSPKNKKILLVYLKFGIYFISTITLIIGLLWIVSQCLMNYYSFPSYISSKIEKQEHVHFPHITICNEKGQILKQNVLHAHGIPTIKRYNYKNDLIWTSNQSGVTPEDLFEKATYDLDEIVYKILVRYINSDEEGNMIYKPKLTDTYNNPEIQVQKLRPYAKCYTLKLSEKVLSHGIYYIKIYGHSAIKLYFHSPGQFMNLNGRMGYRVKVNERTEAQIQYNDIKMLMRQPIQKKNILNSIGKGKTPQTSFDCSNEVYDHCIVSKVLSRMIKKAGCRVPWILDIYRNTPICTDPKAINETFYIHWNTITNQYKDCVDPCQFLIINVSGKNNLKIALNKSEAIFFFTPNVMFSKEILLYTKLSLFAEIGGYVGLLLGFSFFDIVGYISGYMDKKIRGINGSQ